MNDSDFLARLTKIMERWDRDGLPEARAAKPKTNKDPFLGHLPEFIEQVNELSGISYLSAFGEETHTRIRAGDLEALVSGVAALSGLWLRTLGLGMHESPLLSASFYQQDKKHQTLMLCALALREVVLLSPQGRKAVANLGPQPILQDPKAERG